MRDSQQQATARGPEIQASSFAGLLRGYRFSVCTDRVATESALDVRRRVYRKNCGYDVPVPDEYDARSWLLLAEHVDSGEAVNVVDRVYKSPELASQGAQDLTAEAAGEPPRMYGPEEEKPATAKPAQAKPASMANGGKRS